MKNLIFKNYIHLSEEENIKLLEIRNKEFIREVSLNTKEISLSEHMIFVNSLKENSSKKYFAVFIEGQIIGGLNIFDIEKQIKWGMFFDENCDLVSKSISPIFLINYIFETLKKDELSCEIKKENLNAISFNKNMGFVNLKEDDKIITMKTSKEDFKKAKKSILLKRVVKKMQDINLIIKD